MQVKVIALVAVSIVIAVLLASALTSITRVSDSALADIAPPNANGGAESSRPSTAGTNYLPIIFLNSATAGGAWLLAGNAGTNSLTDFLGTTDNMTLTLRVSNTVAYSIVPAVDPLYGFAPNIIGGSGTNSVAPGLSGATIAGGGAPYYPNVITGTGNYATIAGGFSNTADGLASFIGSGEFNSATDSGATVGGGHFNKASGYAASVGGGVSNTASGYASLIGGGQNNTASGYVATVGGGVSNTAGGYASLIGGGSGNTASSYAATVGGGSGNTASGQYATIPGGYSNSANMTYTFAAGRRAQAAHQGSFVWADSTNANFASTANDQFMIRANGGVKIVDGLNAPSFTTFAALHAENASTTGEAAWLRLGNAVDNSPVVTLIKQDSGTGDFMRCYNEFAGTYIQKCHISSSGTFVSGSDFAESLRVVGDKSSYAPGELIVLSGQAGAVAKSGEAYARGLIGVYSTAPGFVGADKNGTVQVNADEIPVAITGIVPVKVTDENGTIAIGDALTSSSMPGIAMKATRAGKIVGYAMEKANANGTLLALVQPGDYVPVAQLDAMNQNGEQKNGYEKELTELKSEVAALKGFVAGAVVAMVALVAVWAMRKKR